MLSSIAGHRPLDGPPRRHLDLICACEHRRTVHNIVSATDCKPVEFRVWVPLFRRRGEAIADEIAGYRVVALVVPRPRIDAHWGEHGADSSGTDERHCKSDIPPSVTARFFGHLYPPRPLARLRG